MGRSLHSRWTLSHSTVESIDCGYLKTGEWPAVFGHEAGLTTRSDDLFAVVQDTKPPANIAFTGLTQMQDGNHPPGFPDRLADILVSGAVAVDQPSLAHCLGRLGDLSLVPQPTVVCTQAFDRAHPLVPSPSSVKRFRGT
jgi:hypothetical protein